MQLVAGSTGDLLDHLGGQDVVAFTGSLETSLKIREHRAMGEKAVRFIAERDSLNACVLGPDATPGTPEFELFVKEVVREMTAKAGQKCTAIRRALVPRATYDSAARAIAEKLREITIGDPRLGSVRMGPLVSRAQRDDVRTRIAELRTETTLLFGDPERCDVVGADAESGGFLSPILLGCERPLAAQKVHALEAFGPVCTLMAYDGLDDAVEIVRRAEGSLVASIVTYDALVAATLVAGICIASRPHTHARSRVRARIDRARFAVTATRSRRSRPCGRRGRTRRNARRVSLHAADRAAGLAFAARGVMFRVDARRRRERKTGSSVPAKFRRSRYRRVRAYGGADDYALRISNISLRLRATRFTPTRTTKRRKRIHSFRAA